MGICRHPGREEDLGVYKAALGKDGPGVYKAVPNCKT
jgi:hypothetical protein